MLVDSERKKREFLKAARYVAYVHVKYAWFYS